MKCEVLVRWVEKRRQGTGKPYSRVNFQMSPDWFEKHKLQIEQKPESKKSSWEKNFPKREELEVCDGKIHAQLELGIDGGCSCCGYPELEIAYKCDKCGFSSYPELPNTLGELQELLNEKINEMD